MIGLLQIMIYLFCVYLVYKGCEIFQIAFVSTADRRVRLTGMALGALSIVGAFIAGGVAVFLTESLVASIGDNMPKFPR